MDDKTFLMVKKTYGLLKAAYVLLIIAAIISGIFLLISGNQQNDASSVMSFWPSIVLIASCYLMLYNKSPYRSKYIAVSLLIYAVWNTTATALNFFAKSPEGMLDSYTITTITGILSVSANSIIVILAFLLLQKSRGKSVTLQIKPFFILYIVLLYTSTYSFMFFSQSLSNDPAMWVALIIGGILGGFLFLLLLQPQFVMFKSLTYESFYLNFILTNPGDAIRMYQDSRAEAAAKLHENRFCTNCGTPLLPHAAYCIKCGGKIRGKE